MKESEIEQILKGAPGYKKLEVIDLNDPSNPEAQKFMQLNKDAIETDRISKLIQMNFL